MRKQRLNKRQHLSAIRHRMQRQERQRTRPLRQMQRSPLRDKIVSLSAWLPWLNNLPRL
jgi:hypothetical protein